MGVFLEEIKLFFLGGGGTKNIATTLPGHWKKYRQRERERKKVFKKSFYDAFVRPKSFFLMDAFSTASAGERKQMLEEERERKKTLQGVKT